jgi:putative tricarboxylic transport membrane protein
MIRIGNKGDFLGGLLIAAAGLAAVIASRAYPMGTAMQMGPGYFPFHLGMLAIGIGLAIAATGVRNQGEKLGRFAWRPFLMMSAAFVAFALLIDTAGFVVALLATILCSCLAARSFRLGEFVIVSGVLIGGCVLVFVWGLGLPLRLFWWM